MPRLTQAIPKYRHHKSSGQALVTLAGRDHYLGEYGSSESKSRYDQLISTYTARRALIAQGVAIQRPEIGDDPLVGEVVLLFQQWAKNHYRRNGKVTGEVNNLMLSLRPLIALYREEQVSRLNLQSFEAVRMHMIRAEKLSRRVINGRIRRIRQFIKWAASREYVPYKLVHVVKGLPALKPGQYDVREIPTVKPVSEAEISAIKSYLPKTIWAMIQVQLFTGMRPGEVVIMRWCDIDRTGDLWKYKPYQHKTEHHGYAREITLGPKAQACLLQYEQVKADAYLFDPKCAVREWRPRKIDPRRSRSITKRSTKRQVGDRYTTQSYGRAVRYACEKAGIIAWSPNQLRHTAATLIRKEFGLEAARIILGHRTTLITEVYAEVVQV